MKFLKHMMQLTDNQAFQLFRMPNLLDYLCKTKGNRRTVALQILEYFVEFLNSVCFGDGGLVRLIKY
jgi:hypothetical protein